MSKDLMHSNKQVKRCIVVHEASQTLFVLNMTLSILIYGSNICKNLISSLDKVDYT